MSAVKSVDWWLFGAVILLLSIGLTWFIAPVLLWQNMLQPQVLGINISFKKQLVFAVVGIIAILLTAFIPRLSIYKNQYILFSYCRPLFLTLTPLGTKVNGASRWLSMGFFLFSLLSLKIALVMYLGYF